MIRKVLALIAAHRSHPSQRLLDTIYGQQAKELRGKVASVRFGCLIRPTYGACSYGATREWLLAAVGAKGNCIAAQDANFERLAEALLAEPVTDTQHKEGL